MPVDNSTSLVSVFRTGTGWTVDVTACNLSASLAAKDFDPYINGGISLLSNWTKTSQVLLTYTGASLPASTPITIVRNTPIARQQELVYGSRLNTANYEGELNTIHKILYDLSSQPPVLLSPSLIDYTSYVKPTWVANVLQAPTARAVSLAVDAAIATAANPASLAVINNLSVGGNTTMAGTLSVTGAFVVSSGSQYAGTVNITSGNLIVGAGNLSVAGTGTITGAVGTGNLTVTGTLGTSGLATLNTLNAGNTAVTGTLSSSGLSTLNSLTVTNATTLSGTSTHTGTAIFNAISNTLTTAPNQLTANSTEMVNANWVRRSIRPYVRANGTGSESYTNNVEATLFFGNEISDLDNVFSAGVFTVPTGATGLYLFDVYVELAAGVTAFYIACKVNGSNVSFTQPAATSVDTASRIETQRKLYLSAGDNVRFALFQTNTGAANRTVSSNSFIDISRLGNHT